MFLVRVQWQGDKQIGNRSNSQCFCLGADAGNFFRNAGLPQIDLEQIWSLAAIQGGDRLSADEFTVAMYLIHERLSGKPIPLTLPRDIIPPSLRSLRSNLVRHNTVSNPFPTSPTFARSSLPATPSPFPCK